MRSTIRYRLSVIGNPSGFTLIELLIVILIIGLLAVATLPVVIPSLQQGKINYAARLLQAELAAKRDQAIRSNRPTGLRFLPEPMDPNRPNVLISRKMISIERGPDYSEGLVQRNFDLTGALVPPSYPPPLSPPLPDNPPLGVPGPYPYLVLREDKFTIHPIAGPIPNPPTQWYFNLRQGDKIRLNDSGRVYTIAGPIGLPVDAASFTPEHYINFGGSYHSNPTNYPVFEFLFLVNGEDDDGDGYVDEGFDGINNDGDIYPSGHPLAGQPIVDPGFNGIDDDLNGLIDDWPELFLHCNSDGSFIYPGLPGTMDPATGNPWVPPFQNEFEYERFSGKFTPGSALTYTVTRRPVPSERSEVVDLPEGVVLDLTTWNAPPPYLPERSRLPVDNATRYVDILLAPGGQVMQAAAHSNSAPMVELPFYHFWLADDDEAYEPFQPGQYPFLLPMLKGSVEDPSLPSGGFAQYPPNLAMLKGNRRLLSLNTKTGQVTTTSVETFFTNNPSYPFKAAEAGVKEEP